MKKSTVMMLIAVIFSVIAISSGIVFFSQMADENKAEQTYENLSSLVSSDLEHEEDVIIESDAEVEHKYNGPTSYEKYLPIYEQNDDFIAWVKIDGTKIDYPVMQTVDDPNSNMPLINPTVITVFRTFRKTVLSTTATTSLFTDTT